MRGGLVVLLPALAAAHRPLEAEDLRVAAMPTPELGDYLGETDGQERRHGRGNLTWADGSSYSGGWSEGAMEGQGVLVYMVGDYQARYNGAWSGGKLVSGWPGCHV